MGRVITVGALMALTFLGLADEKSVSPEEVQKLIFKGGKYWSASEKPSGNSTTFGTTKIEDKPGKRLWLWPAEDRIYDIVDGRTKIMLHWRLRPGEKRPGADENFPIIQYTDEVFSFGIEGQFPGIKLAADADQGKCEVGLSFDTDKASEQRVGLVLQEASNAVKIRAKKKRD